MCKTVLDENLRRTGANVDYVDALARLELEAWKAFVAWDPNRGLTFEFHGFGILRRRVKDIYRELLRRNGDKPLANALSELFAGGNGEDWTLEPPDPDDLAAKFRR